MPAEGAPAGLAIHATAVAIGGRALLIVGRSGTGKSRLAAALVAASTQQRRIVLVGDDRVLLVRSGRGLEARAHPRIGGFIERRGLGLVAMPWRARAVVGGLALLGEDVAGWAVPRRNLPTIGLVDVHERARAEVVLDWWPYPEAEAPRRGDRDGPGVSNDEDWNW